MQICRLDVAFTKLQEAESAEAQYTAGSSHIVTVINTYCSWTSHCFSLLTFSFQSMHSIYPKIISDPDVPWPPLTSSWACKCLISKAWRKCLVFKLLFLVKYTMRKRLLQEQGKDQAQSFDGAGTVATHFECNQQWPWFRRSKMKFPFWIPWIISLKTLWVANCAGPGAESSRSFTRGRWRACARPDMAMLEMGSWKYSGLETPWHLKLRRLVLWTSCQSLWTEPMPA